ncbi:methionine ABC transporter substrate-binding protein, partial [Streptococcus equi]|nr:methionine ABC transporter substrate-binding protein [Streptococcus equi]
NLIAVQKGHKDDEKIKALIEVLQSKEIQDFIKDKYKGAVVPAK